MRLIHLPHTVLLLMLASNVAAEGNISLQIAPSGYGNEHNRLFADNIPPSNYYQSDEALQIQWRHGGFSLHAGIEARQQEGGTSSAHGYLYELFYDRSLGSVDISVGKKRIDMGVGYAYRPLDMIQQQERQSLLAQQSEGVPLLSIERFSETGSVGLLYVNHIEWRSDTISAGEQEWAIKGYNLLGDYDLQWLIHHDEDRLNSAAAGFSWVGGEELELHGSVRYQGRYLAEPEFIFDVPSQTSTMVETTGKNGTVALLGFTWSHTSGYSVIGEYWYDSMAPDSDYWQSVITDKQYIQSGGVVNAGNVAVMSSLTDRIDYAFSQSNLQKKNLFLRLSYDAQWADPAADIYYHPDDGGYSLTLRVAREISQNQQLEFAFRTLNGNDSSVMGNIGDNQQFVISWEIFSAL